MIKPRFEKGNVKVWFEVYRFRSMSYCNPKRKGSLSLESPRVAPNSDDLAWISNQEDPT